MLVACSAFVNYLASKAGVAGLIAKRNGARLICIDPRKTETADKCHQHIALLPGTDGALALGLLLLVLLITALDARAAMRLARSSKPA